MRVACLLLSTPFVLLAGCDWNPFDGGGDGTATPTPTSSKTDDVFRVSSIDNLSSELARRTQARLGRADDFQVIVTQAVYPIGTLMRQGSTIPVDYTACTPAAAPPLAGTPSLFPSYSLSRETAAQFGLDEAVLEGIAQAGGHISRTSGVRLDFADSAISTLSDRDVKQLTAVPLCKELLAEGPVWMVRGYVFGRRTFRFDRSRNNDANLKVTKIASFDVKLADGTSQVAISDNGPVGFLQIVSALAPAPPPSPSPPPPPTPGPTPATSGQPDTPQPLPDIAVKRPALAVRAGRVFVQRDEGDASGTDAKVVAALQATDLPVVRKIEQVDTTKMPSVAQVRYFNDEDVAVANTALNTLSKFYAGARLVRVQLPSPRGQLEVWLPKAGAPSPRPLAIQRNAAAASVLLRPLPQR